MGLFELSLYRQVAIAAWEMETVRLNKNVTEAEALLNATYARANRNWLRARRELTRLQAAYRANAQVIGVAVSRNDEVDVILETEPRFLTGCLTASNCFAEA